MSEQSPEISATDRAALRAATHFKNLLNGISIHDIRRRIDAARSLDTSQLTIDEIKRRYKLALKGYSFNLINGVMDFVYRARPNYGHSLFQHVSELWYPPAEKCLYLGRFNREGTSAFYCSDKPQTAIFEIHPKAGDWFTLLKAGSKSNRVLSIELLHFGMEYACEPEMVAARGSLARHHPKHHLILGSEANKKKWLVIDNYLGAIAIQNVKSGEEHKYKTTIAAGEVLMADKFDGLAYPSAATRLHGINICLRPKRADNLLKPLTIEVFEVISDNDRMYFTKPICSAKSIAADGAINW